MGSVISYIFSSTESETLKTWSKFYEDMKKLEVNCSVTDVLLLFEKALKNAKTHINLGGKDSMDVQKMYVDAGLFNFCSCFSVAKNIYKDDTNEINKYEEKVIRNIKLDRKNRYYLRMCQLFFTPKNTKHLIELCKYTHANCKDFFDVLVGIFINKMIVLEYFTESKNEYLREDEKKTIRTYLDKTEKLFNECKLSDRYKTILTEIYNKTEDMRTFIDDTFLDGQNKESLSQLGDYYQIFTSEKIKLDDEENITEFEEYIIEVLSDINKKPKGKYILATEENEEKEEKEEKEKDKQE
jgi:hypothetical protein